MTTPSKPVVAALSGERIDPPPVWLMRQAGRYLPEYRELRQAAPTFLGLCFDPAKAAEATLQPVRRFGLDAAILFSDILVVPHALGQMVDFEEGDGPRLDPVRDQAALARLSPDGLAGRLAPVYEAVERTAAALPDRVALIGFAGAPWTVATYMVEGRGSRDHAAAKRWALGDPDGFRRLVDLLVEATVRHLLGQARAGAEAVQLFDSWAGALPAEACRRFCVAPIREIARRVKAEFPGVPVTAFVRGAPAALRELAGAEEIDALSLDHAVDPAWAAAALHSRAALQGNLDPVLLLAGGPELGRAARAIRARLSGGAHVFNLGHGVLPGTPVDHVAELVGAVRGELGH